MASLKIKTERGIDAARNFAQTKKQMDKDFALLQLKQTREANELIAEYRKAFREYFCIAAEGLLPDPNNAFYNETHHIVLQHIEHGDAYIIPNPDKQPAPLAEEDDTAKDAENARPNRRIIN